MRAAAVQFRPDFANADSNAQRITRDLRHLADEGVELAVYPEAALTGYCFDTREEAESAALILEDSEQIHEIGNACKENRIHCIFGFAEKNGRNLYNTAAFFGPTGLLGVYRKTHIPCLGLDRFVTEGDSLTVFDSPIGRIGILICFDIRFPEPARTMALSGADIICLPTNWPTSAEPSSDILCPARAIENHVFIVASNRVGVEKDFRFIGRSKIVAPGGDVLQALDNEEEGTIIADIEVAEARNKRLVRIPGKYEMDLFAARRPELYKAPAKV